jgi:hypothetical protein
MQKKIISKCSECPNLEKQYVTNNDYTIEIICKCSEVEKTIEVIDIVEKRNGLKNSNFTEKRQMNISIPIWCPLEEVNINYVDSNES